MTVSAVAYSLPGRTASGLPVGHGIVAVDPSVIPLGTRMYVPGYGEAVVLQGIDAAGNPTGTLHEGAMSLVERLITDTTDDEYYQALLTAQAYLHSLGITAWQDAILGSYGDAGDATPTYLAAGASGQLTGRVVGALWWDRSRGAEQIEELVERRAAGKAGRGRSACSHSAASPGMSARATPRTFSR